MDDPYNIIIRMPNWLGDLVMSTPLLADIRKKWPTANLTAMCLGTAAPLLVGNPHLNEVFSFSRPNEFLRRQEKRNLIERLRQGKYDLGILLPNSFSSAWWFWRGKVQNRVGFRSDGRGLLLNKAIRCPKERGHEHLITTYKRLLVPLGMPLSDSSPELFVLDEERKAIREILKQHHIPKEGTLIGINPGAAYGSAKCWPLERFHALTLKLLKDENTYILFFGDEAGAPLVKKICDDIPSSRVINLAGLTTLRELMALIEACNVFLTNDSGPMHIAAALKTPLVALFGSTNATVTGPYKQGVVIHKHVSCSPCYLRTCPIDFRCMTQISVEEVYAALQSLLEGK